MGEEALDVVTVEVTAKGILDAAQGFQSAAQKFQTAAQKLRAATTEFETATAELRDASDRSLVVTTQLRKAELEFQGAVTDSAARLATGSPIDAAAGAAITALKAALHKVPPAETSVRDAKDKLSTAKVELGAAEEELRAAGKELCAAGDQVRDVAHADVLFIADKASDKAVLAYREIDHLQQISTNPILKFALDDWQHKQKDLATKVSRRENKSVDLTNQIFNIIGWYAVFQGVVLTAVAQLAQSNTGGATPMCKKIWFPTILTLFSTIVIVGGILYKFHGLEELEITIITEKDARLVSLSLNAPIPLVFLVSVPILVCLVLSRFSISPR